MTKLLYAGALIASMTFSMSAAELVHDGQATAVIILPNDPDAQEQLAADELVEHLRLISGATLSVVKAGEVPVGLIPLYLGGAADAALDETTRKAGDNPSSFTLRVSSDRIDIRGLSAEGTLFGVYELLEQLGVRWYNPGELGRVVPKVKTVELKAGTTTQAPSLKLRLMQPWTEHKSGWIARQRLGGSRRSTGAHGIPPFNDTKKKQQLFDEHPEMFALVGGKRQMRQICVSNPRTAELTAQLLRGNHRPTTEEIYVGMGPDDGGGYCECPGCEQLDGGVIDPFRSSLSRSGRYIEFFNRVLKLLEDDYPKMHLVWYVYGNHIMPPPEGMYVNPRIIGVFAPINMDRLRSMNNPMGSERHTLRWIMEQWRKTTPAEFYYRGYYNNLACVQLPKTQLDRARNDIPEMYRLGVSVMRVNPIAGTSMWDTDPISLYVAARLMWKIDTDVDALLAEFYRLFYGPAEEPMRRYLEGLEAAVRDTPWFTGSSYLYFPMFMDHPRRGQLRDLLDQAVAAVEKPGTAPEYRERVARLRLGYERMDLFLDMILARNSHDYDTAHRKLTSYIELSENLREQVIEGEGSYAFLKGGGSISYLNRFFRLPVESGYERTMKLGKLVAPLADEWLFVIDPTELGEMSGWQRPGEIGGNWRPLKTASRSWSDQGLHYYKGVAWYRQKVAIPENIRGKPVYLWFGGVDELAAVWVNGRYLGTNREPEEGLPGIPGTFRPFDLDASRAILPGADNWVVVKATNKNLDELGMGGIVGPVMFWTPDNPEWRPGE